MRSRWTGVLWANLHLLFWLSLVPFATGWMGENHFAHGPSRFTASVLLDVRAGVLHPDPDPGGPAWHRLSIATALGRRIKEIGSLVAYTAAIVFAFINPNISLAIYFLVALMWLIPDQRFEKTLGSR